MLYIVSVRIANIMALDQQFYSQFNMWCSKIVRIANIMTLDQQFYSQFNMWCSKIVRIANIMALDQQFYSQFNMWCSKIVLVPVIKWHKGLEEELQIFLTLATDQVNC
jgi:hypothetical protein